VRTRKWCLEHGWNGEFYVNFDGASGDGPDGSPLRSWDDMRRFGFFSAGGGRAYWHPLTLLEHGDRIWVYQGDAGYVGCGIVSAPAVPAADAILSGVPFFSLPLSADYCRSKGVDDAEYVVPVRWLFTVALCDAAMLPYHNRSTVARPLTVKWALTLSRLRELWGIK